MTDCARCGTANEADRKFCRECGARLGISCPACGTLETGESKFCGECGAALGPALHRAVFEPRPEQTPPAPLTERRLVSVMFADLVGFTGLSESRDPEAVRELLSDYYDLARQVVGRYQGQIEKFIGDAVMAVWGAPLAHEDDAERAVRCALDLVHSVRALGDSRAMPELALRAGIQTGEAAVNIGAEGQGMVVGDIVNTASRLEAVAEPGTVVVGEATQRAASRAVAFRRLSDQHLKGKSIAVPAWQATHLVALRGGARRETLEPPFVGRNDELWLLKELYHATGRDRRIRAVSIMGQAGMGKTRLAWELEKYASGLADESRWLQGRSPSYDEGLSYWALGEMVRRAADIAEGEATSSARDKLKALLGRVVTDDAERRWLEGPLASLLALHEVPESERADLFAAWRTFFERLAADSPVVLVFEDLHWADAGVLDFIENLLQWTRGAPVLIVTLARPELLEKRPNWGAGQRNFTSLRLDPLAEVEMRALLDGLVAGLPETLVRQILERAEGVPLYAVETIRMLIDQEALVASDRGYRLAHEPDRLTLPETLQSLIAARLDGLPVGERRLLREASVLGQTFTHQAISAVSNVTPAELEPPLRSLMEKELLRLEADPRSPERGHIAFVQAAIREVAYAGIGRAERRSLHLAAARYLAGLDDDEIVGVVASHYLAAYQAAPDHEDATAVRDQARRFLLAAAERARRLHSYEQTLAYLEQALLVTEDEGERASTLERAGEVARAAGDRAAAERYLEPAIEWYRSAGNRSALLRATGILATALINDVHIEQAIDLLKPAIDDARSEGGGPELVPLLASLARAHLNRAEWPATLEWSEQAIVEGERYEQITAVVEALVNRGTAVAGLGRPHEAQAILRGTLVLAERYGLWEAALRATNNLAVLESEESPIHAEELARTGLALAQRAGEVGWLSRFRHLLFELRLEQGDWDRVLSEVEDLDPDAMVAHEWEHINDNLAVVAAYRGEAELAHQLLGRWKSAPERTVTQHDAAHHMAVAMVAFAEGRLDDAFAASRLAAASNSYHHAGHFLAGRSALWLRNAEGLRAAIEAFAEMPVQSRLRQAQRATLTAGERALSADPATADYADAIARWNELENRLGLALAHLELATFGAAGEAAEQAAAEARRLLASLGAEGLMGRLRNPAATKA